MTLSPHAVLGRAAFLATSWTWCIGMFLPVLLIRDFGALGFLVFGVPNILGAAALGWVLNREQAGMILSRHRVLVLTFTAVTVAFQAWFLLTFVFSIASPIGPMPGLFDLLAWPLIPAHLLFTVAFGLAWFERARAVAGVFAWLGSAAAIIAYFVLGGGAANGAPPALPAGTVAAMAPCCALGFLLCPYLDVTFLAMRRDTENPAGRAVFGLGFFVFFAVMIVFTAIYAGIPNLGGSALAAVFVHLLGQLCFTIAVHLSGAWRIASPRARTAVVGGAALLVLAASAAGDLAPYLSRVLAREEVIYRLFMSFYGLAFPAYVYVCMIPSRRSVPALWTAIVWLGVCVLASPFYYFGFIERATLMLLPGVLIVLLGRPLLWLMPSPRAG